MIVMAILRRKEIRALSEKDRADRLRELQLELAKERASSEIGGSVKSPGRIGEIRKTIARMKGMERERVLQGMQKTKQPGKAASHKQAQRGDRP